MFGKPKLYYLDAETTGLEQDLRLTTFSTNINELVVDYICWIRENNIDYEHTLCSDIREAKNGKLISTLVQSDDLRYVEMSPVRFTFRETLMLYVSKLSGKKL